MTWRLPVLMILSSGALAAACGAWPAVMPVVVGALTAIAFEGWGRP